MNKQREMRLLTLLLCLTTATLCACDPSTEEECENEEAQVEVCAQEFLLYRNQSVPESEVTIGQFCRENKNKEQCLRDHSKKCLSHSANQAITELIGSMSKQNQAICSSKARRNLFVRSNRCLNKQPQATSCYSSFIRDIHGIHQFGQEEKIPIICCTYHSFIACLQSQVKTCGREISKALTKLVENYSGETLNYVCRDYKSTSKCDKKASNSITNMDAINEQVPKSFFSLLVKIYLS